MNERIFCEKKGEQHHCFAKKKLKDNGGPPRNRLQSSSSALTTKLVSSALKARMQLCWCALFFRGVFEITLKMQPKLYMKNFSMPITESSFLFYF